MLKMLNRQNYTRYKLSIQDFEIMIQLTWFILPCTILFLVSVISFYYWLSILAGSLGVFLIVGLCIKVNKIDNKKIDAIGIIED